ncbi:efflux RND transporter periplasmic adaptor subunit [Anaeromyxobacter oryzae]|uniref:RND transporter n=1 Tax=Anaeromyxobacter oryzae TaxID=2918170 RepID=A0ABM7WP67_9BACT|nr:efflux RND transporter periplasmic adaptor subunit [Anaeromyxobacter oryzae]BDG01261.1 RND transporter [Anaeromyxobacter oryzae]
MPRRPRALARWRWVTAALLVIACGNGAGRGGKAAGQARPPTPVVVGTTERRDVPDTLGAVGQVQAFTTVSVRPLVGGELVKVSFADGEQVREGQQLFQIDPRPYQAALAQVRAARARAREQAANARADARRYAELVKKEYVTRQQYQSALATAAALDADVAAGEAAVRKAELDLANCRIDAPISGRTGAVLVQVGNVVQANQANPLVVIARTQPVYVSFTVPEANVAALRNGLGKMRVTATAPGTPPHDGALSFVNNTVDPAAGTILAKATFRNDDEALWPGQFVDVSVTLGVLRGAVVAPAAAVVTGQAGTFTWVVKGDGTVEQRPIAVARSDARIAVVAKGLGPGERVVTDGQLGLEPGARVAIKEASRPAGGAEPQHAERERPERPRVQARTP